MESCGQTHGDGPRTAEKERQTVQGEVAVWRSRYENHINQETAKVEWSMEEELRLVQLHD